MAGERRLRGCTLSVAKALLAHELQRSAQAFVVLVTECDEAKRISAGTHLRRQKLHQPADRTRQRVDLGFSNGRAADAGGKLCQTSGHGDLLQHGRNLMAAQVETNGFAVGNAYSRRPRLGLRLGKVWHTEGIIRFLRRYQKITEDVARDSGMKWFFRCPSFMSLCSKNRLTVFSPQEQSAPDVRRSPRQPGSRLHLCCLATNRSNSSARVENADAPVIAGSLLLRNRSVKIQKGKGRLLQPPPRLKLSLALQPA